jgi:hypothetical protein
MEVARSVSGGTDIIVHPRLVEKFEYDIQVFDDGSIPELKRSRKMFVRIRDEGNTLGFREKKSSDTALLEVPLRDILTTTTVTMQTKHMMVKKDNLLVQVECGHLLIMVNLLG